MKKTVLYIILSLAISVSIQASRPTSHATNLNILNVGCNFLQLSWTNGDGSARLIVAREGAPTTWTPTDYSVYSANPLFGKGTDYGSGNFIVYNSGNTNYVDIDSLKSGKTYYFTIFEHDNNGSSTLYLTTGNPPGLNSSTYSSQLEFSIKTMDSCEMHNSFTFTNQSTSTIPGITYLFDFGDGNYSQADTVTHSYKVSGPIFINLNLSGQNPGCVESLSKKVRVYPKKVVTIDYSTFEDTQCMAVNYFEIDPQPIVSPLPKSFTYFWDFRDGVQSTFKKMKHRYNQAGHYNVAVEIVTNVNMMPTGCKDTIIIPLTVLEDPQGNGIISDSVQCLQNNLFDFTGNNTTLAGYQWNFGDGKYHNGRVAQHIYQTFGIIYPSLKVTDSYGCTKTDSFRIEVLKVLSSNYAGLDTAYCTSMSPIQLYPQYNFGFYSGYPVNNHSLIPNLAGNYKLMYTINLANCKDSTSKNFRIKQSPDPSLGNDTLILNNQQLILDAGIAARYLWSTSDTTRTFLIDGKTSPGGNSTYFVKSTNSNGCNGYDTIIVSIDYNSRNIVNVKEPFNIFPNPVVTFLNLKNPYNKEFEWQIYNSNGQLLVSGNSEKSVIDCSSLHPGVYHIGIKGKEDIQNLMFIKL